MVCLNLFIPTACVLYGQQFRCANSRHHHQSLQHLLIQDHGNTVGAAIKIFVYHIRVPQDLLHFPEVFKVVCF